VRYSEFSLELMIRDNKDKEYKFLTTNLFGEVIPEESFHKITPKGNGVTVYLKKKKEDEEWRELESKKASIGENDRVIPVNRFRQLYSTGDEDMKNSLRKSFGIDEKTAEALMKADLDDKVNENKIPEEIRGKINIGKDEPEKEN
jgi:hypothetical protein